MVFACAPWGAVNDGRASNIPWSDDWELYMSMAERFCKTELGRKEIRERAHALSRTARNLLFAVDASRPASEWLGLVQGGTQADLQMLLDAGLIALQAHSGGAVAPVTEPVVATPVAAPPGEPTYSALYDSLNALVKAQLGLLKGYKFSLEIERAATLDDLREVAVRVVDEIDANKGGVAAQAARDTLGLVS